MIDISPEFSPFTLIITIAIPPDQHASLLEHFVDTTRDHSRRPGFVSCTIHSSADNGYFAEYIQWRDRKSFDAATTSVEGNEHIERFLPVSDVGIYDVVAVYNAQHDQSPRMAPRRDVVTTVTVIRCTSGRQVELVTAVRAAAEKLSGQPGFVSAAVHRGTDRDRVAVYGQWTDERALDTALSATQVVPLLEQVRAMGTPARRAYRVEFIAAGPTV